MALVTAHITLSQGTNVEEVIVTDDSTNEQDETYTNRVLNIYDSEGNALAGYPNPNDFNFDDFDDNVFTIAGLTQDKVLSVELVLTPTTPVGGSVYTYTAQTATNRYLQQGLYNIQKSRFLDEDLSDNLGTQSQLNSIDLIIEMNNSQTAVMYSSLVAAQNALNRGQNIIDNLIL